MTDTIETNRDWRAHFNAVSERAGPLEFFRQVERTIGGQPMDGEQIALAAGAARLALDLTSSDCLLDLCCGNGLVTVRLARACRHVYAVDYSRHLIEVARRHHPAPNVRYIVCPVTELTASHLAGERPNKVCMIGALQLFTVASLKKLFDTVGGLVEASAPLYFSDIPDVDHLYDFYDTAERRADYEHRRAAGNEAIGTWWSRRHLAELFTSSGYTAEFREQNRRSFGAHYRFDVLARPGPLPS